MPLNLYFADHQLIPESPWAATEGSLSPRRVADQSPIILNEKMWALQPWTEFLRRYATNISVNSAKAYGRDLFRFAQYLDHRALSLSAVIEDDLHDYRRSRKEQGLSDRSWQREAVVLRAFFDFLVEDKLIDKVPWQPMGRYSVLKPRGESYALEVRALTHEQWLHFKNVGLGGLLPDGSVDYSFRGISTQRNATAVELALTTGMRLQEWRTVLLPEIFPENGGGSSVVLEATAKGRRRRTVYIPQKTVHDIDLYTRVERRRVVRKAQPRLRRNIEDLAVVQEIKEDAGKVAYTYLGETYRVPFHLISVQHRAVLVEQIGDYIEPLSLFVGSTGQPPSQRSWHGVFSAANDRLRQFDEDLARPRRAITPHDLRHTFAVVMLQSLQLRALERPRNSGSGMGSISEHIIHNPLLTVQRLLGHASPSTTMNYLRYIEESDALIQRAFDAWNDPLKNYSDYVIGRIMGDSKAGEENETTSTHDHG